MNPFFSFNKEQFNKLFPFYFTVNRELQIISHGKSIGKLFVFEKDKIFNHYFNISRPLTEINSLDDIISLRDQFVVLDSALLKNNMLRGQFEYLVESDEVLFVGSPWFNSIDQLTENNLVINDFAVHNPLIDLLHLMKTVEITNDDLKHLIFTINKQKNDLKIANKEIEEIALFPTQNPDPLIRINFSGELITMNPAAEKLMSFDFENKIFSGKELFKDLVTDIDINVERLVFEARSNEKDYSFVCIPMKKHGYINIYGRDISKQKKVRQELERLSLIIQQTKNSVIVTDAGGKIEWVNDAFSQITGYNLDEIKDKTPGSFLQGPETDPKVAGYMNEQIQLAKPFLCEIYEYKKSGEGYWLRINGQPVFDSKGKVINYFAIEEDITYEKQAQEKIQASARRMSSLISNLHAGILLEDEKRNIVLINQQFCNMFNIPADPALMIGADCSKASEQSKHLFLNPQEFINRITTVLQDKELALGDILEVADGRFFERDFIPIWNENKYEGHLWMYSDITERVKSENLLKIAKQETELLAQTKQNFLTNMSHEIRTPMNAILGMSRQLQKTRLNERQHFFLDTISNASENLLVIINDILDLSKMEAGKLTLEQIGFEPKLVVSKVLQVMMHKAEEKGLVLTNSFYDSQLADVFIGDPYRLNQILLNLVSNAIKFTEKGSVDIICKVINQTASHQKVRVKIIDSGIGMDESFVNKLFSKFTQEDDSVSRKSGGTGLGMSICKDLIELMRGVIHIESLKGEGTTVFFDLEFKKGMKTDIPVKGYSTLNIENLAGSKILLVDDNEMNRVLAHTILDDYAVSVTAVTNGADAVDLLKKQAFDLVLMDLQMPIMNGLQATQLIRNDLNLKIPIVALTANAIKGEKEKCMEAGMNDYLSKPYEEEDFLQKVSQWLSKPIASTSKDLAKTKEVPLYDLSKLESIAKGNRNFVNKMIALFVKQGPASVKEIKEAYTTGDFEKISKIAHRLIPAIDNMGISSLKNVITEIEINAIHYKDSVLLDRLILKLDTTITEVVKNLKVVNNKN